VIVEEVWFSATARATACFVGQGSSAAASAAVDVLPVQQAHGSRKQVYLYDEVSFIV
jgi:hypothetical protein